MWAITLRAGGQVASSSPAPPGFPEGPHRDVVVKLCTDCHPVSQIIRKRESRARWSAIIAQMINEGADISDENYDKVLTYFSVVLGKKVRINEADAAVIAETFDIDKDLASAVVKYRTEKGPFKSWKDVAAVPGIDAALVEALKDNLEFGVNRPS